MIIPGITWSGHRDPATAELAIRVDGAWMHALTAGTPNEWWSPLVMTVPSDPGTEATRLPIDFEDLADFEEDVGPVVAKGPKPLTSVLIPRKPWRKSRSIPSADLTRNNFAGWPDRLAAIMLSSRRMYGALARELLFQSDTKVLTYQGLALIKSSGHLTDPTNVDSATFGNLHTSKNFDTTGWEFAQETKFARLGPGGYGLDMQVTHVLGGTAMKKKFDRMFKRVIVLEDSGSNDAAAGVTNIHSTEIEGGVVPIVTSQLDRHPWLLGAGVGKDQWWTISTTYAARPLGVVAEGGGAPTVSILDVGSEYEILNQAILIIARMAMNGGAAFPHTIDEHRGS